MKNDRIAIIRETLPSETLSVIFNFFVGIILIFILDGFENFGAIIIMVPALLAIRGNISGSYCARVARDLLIGCYNRKTLNQNILATTLLLLIVSLMISIAGYLLCLVLHITHSMKISDFFLFPLIVLIFTSIISFSGSTIFSNFLFRKGLNPNNIIPPIWSGIDDMLIILNILLSLFILGVK